MAQVLPKDEDFAAPDWLTPGSGTTSSLPWFFWYLGFKPTEGINTGTADGASYPYRVGGELETYGRQELYIEDGDKTMPALMTDTSGLGHAYQRSVLCREEDSVAVEDIDFKVVFGLVNAGGSVLGSTFGGGSRGLSPTTGGQFPFPSGDAADTDDDHQNLTGGGGGFAGNWTSAGSNSPISGQPVNKWALWNGNSLFFRMGGGYPQANYASAAGTGSRAWWTDHVDGYSFAAYPVVNSGANRVDLYLELWQVKFSGSGSSTGTARRLIQQIVQGGANLIDFEQPYHLRVTCDNDGTPDVDFTAFIGQVKRTGLPNLEEAQVFKSGVFTNGDNFTVGTNVTHTPSTGAVKDGHADKITAFADKTFGWGMGRDRTQDVAARLDPDATDPPPNFMSGIEGVYSVQVKDVSAGTVLYRDEFERSVTGGGFNVNIINPITGLFGTTGNQANGLFTFDGYAQEYGTGQDEVRRLMLWTDGQTDTTAPNDFVTLDYDADDSTTAGTMCFDVQRTFVHERPSSQYFNHHRSIDFKPGTLNPSGGGSAPSSYLFEFGVALRGYHDGNKIQGTTAYLTWTTNASATLSYASLTIAARSADYKTGNPWSGETVIIARKKWSSASELTAFLSICNLYDGNFHTLDFRAEVYSKASSPEAAAEYHVALNGTPIELDDTTAPNQSDTASPYPVVEPGPTYYFGTQEGFFFWSTNPEVQSGTGYRNYNPFQAKNWVEGALTADPGDDDDPDSQASIVVSGEGSAVGSLNATSGALGISGSGVWDVEVEVMVDSAWSIRRSRFESGHTYTSPSSTKARRRWNVTVRGASLAVYQSVQTFYNSHSGMETPFSFIVPIPNDGTEAGSTAEATETVVAWFAADSLEVREVGPQVYDISFAIGEELVA